ncbi:unnamed protein product [Candidula unifasciata]|uniref:Sulfhydryl oxidase n=1 Tax=Candidula unifasciata TaxID=100452 RepID=A0A8S3Z8H9_9EUPU|nr:unnamed protein product [Candidula unifasciata]
MPPKQKPKIDVESEKEAWGGPTPKELATEPGWLNKVAGEVAEIKEREFQKRSQRYDPYSFLDKMAMPFDTIPRPDDFKKGLPADESGEGDGKKPMPHCKACTDFKTWMELTAHPRRSMTKEEREEKECPLDSELLGRNTWAFLHTMAAYYPEKPSAEQQGNMKKFITLLSHFYPCHKCASHLREDLKTNIPDVSSNVKLSQWFCNLHNGVNTRLGKTEFDCSKVLERWRDGWADGSCD